MKPRLKHQIVVEHIRLSLYAAGSGAEAKQVRAQQVQDETRRHQIVQSHHDAAIRQAEQLRREQLERDSRSR